MMDDIQLKKIVLAINGFGGFGAVPIYRTIVNKRFEPKIDVLMQWPSEKGFDKCYVVGYIKYDLMTGTIKLVEAPIGHPYSESAKDEIIDFLEKLCSKYNDLNQYSYIKNKKEVP